MSDAPRAARLGLLALTFFRESLECYETFLRCHGALFDSSGIMWLSARFTCAIPNILHPNDTQPISLPRSSCYGGLSACRIAPGTSIYD